MTSAKPKIKIIDHKAEWNEKQRKEHEQATLRQSVRTQFSKLRGNPYEREDDDPLVSAVDEDAMLAAHLETTDITPDSDKPDQSLDTQLTPTTSNVDDDG